MDAIPGSRHAEQDLPVKPANEMSSRRTGMSFQRTRMGADRTLMAVIRTSLSFISLGFAIVQMSSAVTPERAESGRHIGLMLIATGTALMLLGTVNHLAFTRNLSRERARMKTEGLIHAESPFPAIIVLTSACAILALGIAATVSVALRSWPFG